MFINKNYEGVKRLADEMRQSFYKAAVGAGLTLALAFGVVTQTREGGLLDMHRYVEDHTKTNLSLYPEKDPATVRAYFERAADEFNGNANNIALSMSVLGTLNMGFYYLLSRRADRALATFSPRN